MRSRREPEAFPERAEPTAGTGRARRSGHSACGAAYLSAPGRVIRSRSAVEAVPTSAGAMRRRMLFTVPGFASLFSLTLTVTEGSGSLRRHDTFYASARE